MNNTKEIFGIDLDKEYIHVNSVEEAESFLDYAHNVGFTSDSLSESNYLAYPYFGITGDIEEKSDDIVGWMTASKFKGGYEYKEWLKIVTCISEFDASSLDSLL